MSKKARIKQVKSKFNLIDFLSKVSLGIVFLAIIFFIVNYLITTFYRPSLNTHIPPQPTLHYPQNIYEKTPKICKEYGVLDRKDYLAVYSVKKGDTLLSIAKYQLGDTSRVQELINLNIDNYPSLSITTPFIEKDWKLLLPPRDIRSSGKINEYGGNIRYEGQTSFQVDSPHGALGVIDTQDIKLSKLPKNGACVTILYDYADFSPKLLKFIVQ